eukprot:1707823-Rhodomonas_salina.1
MAYVSTGHCIVPRQNDKKHGLCEYRTSRSTIPRPPPLYCLPSTLSGGPSTPYARSVPDIECRD